MLLTSRGLLLPSNEMLGFIFTLGFPDSGGLLCLPPSWAIFSLVLGGMMGILLLSGGDDDNDLSVVVAVGPNALLLFAINVLTWIFRTLINLYNSNSMRLMCTVLILFSEVLYIN